MAERDLGELTLRELLTDAERLARELVEHLEQNFIPKAHRLRKLVRSADHETMEANLRDVRDLTVRTHVAQVFDSDQFTRQVYDRLHEYLEAIDSTVSRSLSGQE
ncbi:MAG: hypothetical protein ACREJB_18815 [Planctomycetaceae bacterium]